MGDMMRVISESIFAPVSDSEISDRQEKYVDKLMDIVRSNVGPWKLFSEGMPFGISQTISYIRGRDDDYETPYDGAESEFYRICREHHVEFPNSDYANNAISECIHDIIDECDMNFHDVLPEAIFFNDPSPISFIKGGRHASPDEREKDMQAVRMKTSATLFDVDEVDDLYDNSDGGDWGLGVIAHPADAADNNEVKGTAVLYNLDGINSRYIIGLGRATIFVKNNDDLADLVDDGSGASLGFHTNSTDWTWE
jgi:hypothetical protein